METDEQNGPKAGHEAPPANDFAEIIEGRLWRSRRNAARFYERDVRTIDRWHRIAGLTSSRHYRDGYPWTVYLDADLERCDETARANARGQARTTLGGR